MDEHTSLQRYYYYISNGIDAHHIADMDPHWFDHVIKLLSPTIVERYQDTLASLGNEMRENYILSVKTAIIDFVLQDPRPQSYADEDEPTPAMADLDAARREHAATWAQNYRATLAHLSQTYLTVEPSLFSLQKQWHRHFEGFRLFEPEQFMGPTVAPFELRAFRSLMVQRFEKAHERLMTLWYPAILNLFYSTRESWQRLSAERLRRHFRAFALVMSAQLCHVIKQSIRNLVDLFRADSALVAQHGGTPCTLQVRLVLDDTRVRIEPEPREVITSIVALIDLMSTSFDRIPRIETQLTGVGADPTTPSSPAMAQAPLEDELIPVEFAKTFPRALEDAKVALTSVLKRAFTEVEHYTQHAYRGHDDLIQRVEEAKVRAFLKPENGPHSVTELMAEVQRYRRISNPDIQAAFPYVVHMPLVEMHCDDFLKDLSGRALELSNRVMNSMVVDNKASNQAICAQFQDIAQNLAKMPASVGDMMRMIEFLGVTRAETLPRLERDVNQMKQRLYFLLIYSDMQKDDFEANAVLIAWPGRIQTVLRDADEMVVKARVANSEELVQRKDKIAGEVALLAHQVTDFHTLSDFGDMSKYLRLAQKFQTKLDAAQTRVQVLNTEEGQMGWEVSRFPELETIATELHAYLSLYQTATTFQKLLQQWLSGVFIQLHPEEIEREVTTMWKTLYKLTSTFADHPVPLELAEMAKAQIDRFKLHLPLILCLGNPGLKDRHWTQISDIVGMRFQPDHQTTLSAVLERGFNEYLPRLEILSATASKEYTLEKTISKMNAEWDGVQLTIIPYRDSGTFILAAVDEIQSMFDDHIVKTQTMRGSPFIKPFEAESKALETQLLTMQDMLDEWLKMQATWLYLEPIFSSEDIMRQLPSEGRRFQNINKIWRAHMQAAATNPAIIHVAAQDGVVDKLKECNADLELIQKGLNQYLELKRLFFPRFFFLSNDEMLEILSETRDPTRVQPHLKKCFEGIDSLEFTKLGVITDLYSAQKERIALVQPVPTASSGSVEAWLLQVQRSMLASMQDICRRAVKDYTEKPREAWVLDWPGQAVIAVSSIFWTYEVEQAIMRPDPKSLAAYLELSTKRLESIVALVRGQLTKLNRITLEALVVIEVHARDVIQQLVAAGTSNTNDFNWLSQLRYYFDDESSTIAVKMINSVQKYGYEYLGNTGRLVITTLTDRCYRALFGALQLNLGGAPEGPAGTGKTETVKDLAKAIAVACVVYNCSDGLDYLAMGKFFKGLAAAGAWACFDEFNRIDLEVLSVVAQQILTIQRAKAAGLTRFVFEGTELDLNERANCFITMNPGYAGRSELPDNLKALFRPVAMMVPDYTLIAEISLYSFGYVQARALSVKITATYRLCSEQLSSQDHYDYGMRAVKSVLNACGALKLKYPSENENILVLRSIIDVNLPKFLANDIPLFKGITADLFPGVKLPTPDYTDLLAAIASACQAKGLQCLPNFVEKVLQVYEMMLVRHGFMLVGETFSGKTQALYVLQAALTELANQGHTHENRVLIQTLNPKSITMGQLYGQFDAVSHEWSDGVLAVGFRGFASSPTPERKWVVFDGPVDAVWIENMNTVLDDNKKLCLNSGEIIQLSASMSMIFEVRDLAVASPATVSRCGMIYLEPGRLGWRESLLVSWSERHATLVAAESWPEVFAMVDHYLTPSLAWVREHGREVSETMDSNLAVSWMNVFESAVAEARLATGNADSSLRVLHGFVVFALIWSVGGALDEASQLRFGDHVRQLTQLSNEHITTSMTLPEAGSVYDYVFKHEAESGEFQWINWLDLSKKAFTIPPKAKFDAIMVPTLNTVRYKYMLQLLLRNDHHVLFVGPTGTGKSLYIRDAMLNEMDKALFVPVFVNFSAQTTAKQTQDIIESRMDKRRKGVYGPPITKKAVIFVDDLNMPAKEIYGAQPPIELLRQYLDHDGWYNLTDNTFTSFVDVLLVGAMGSGGRNVPTSRFLRHFNTIAISSADDATLARIFTTILSWHLASHPFDPSVVAMTDSLIAATCAIYRRSMTKLLPIPSKSHYTFNLRDFSRVVQGLLLARPAAISSTSKMVKLWYHEVSRVFGDRLVDQTDRHWLFTQAQAVIGEVFETKMEAFYDEPDSDALEAVASGVTFSTLLSTRENGFAYDEVTQWSELTAKVTAQLTEFNVLSKKPMPLVMFPFAIDHLLRISRVLLQPRGNLLLAGVGGSGRQSLARLASHLADYAVFQIEISKSYNTANWHDDLKNVLRAAGGEGKPTTFLLADTQIPDESFLEDINNLLNSGEVPNLWPNDEKQLLFEQMRASGFQSADTSNTALFSAFVERCRENLHLVLAMSPISDVFRTRLRKFPSFVNCCTIDWFFEWPADALEMLAVKKFEDIDVAPDVRPRIVTLCQYLHQDVQTRSRAYLNQLRRHNYVTPTSYLELLATYQTLLSRKQEEVRNAKFRYTNGLEQIDFASNAVGQMQIELAEMQPQLIIAQGDTAKLMEEIQVESKGVQEVRVVAQADEAVANAKASEVKAIKDDCEMQLAEAIPALEAAVAALDTLKSSDITVLKSMKSPPAGVKLVMEAVCLMKDIKPVKIPDPAGSGKKIEDFWGPSKTLMSDMKFLENLRNYDKDNIAPHIMKQIRLKYMENPEFDPEKIKTASSAAEGLCRWVRAMELYDRVAKVVAPKKEALGKAEEELTVVMSSLQEKRAALQLVEDKMARLEQKLKATTDKKIALENQVDSVSKQLVRAGKLIASLGDEKERWTQCAADLHEQLSTLPGDILIASAVVSYLGAFTKSFRDDAIAAWSQVCREHAIPCSDAVRLARLLGDPVKIRAWMLVGLPNDAFSINNGLIMATSRRWPLMIDPQGQANRWIKNMEKAHNIQIIKLSDSDYVRTLENAVQFGTPVLLENVGEDLDPVLEPLLLKQTFTQGGVTCIRLGDSTVEYSPDFRFYITTKLANPHYLPELSTKVTLINFMITPDGLEDQLLGIVIAKERPELEELKSQLLIQSAENAKQMQEIEDKILHVLSASQGKILEDETGIQILSSSKVLAKQIAEKQLNTEATERKIDEIRLKYRPIAAYASSLFFCIADLASIEPMYQYSLSWYITLFGNSIDQSEKSQDIDVRLETLKKHFTYNLYANVCRSLFEKDKLVFSFLLNAAILNSAGQLNDTEWRFLLTGAVGMETPKHLNPDPSWITDKAWYGISKLAEIPPFQDLALTFADALPQWKKLFDATEPHTSPLPSPWSDTASPFQHLLLIRCLRPDKLVAATRHFIAGSIGAVFTEPPTFNLALSFADSHCCQPLIFVLSPGADPMTALLKFAEDKKMSGDRLMAISLGQGQGPIAAKMIQKGMQEGRWVVLQNAHLAISWMPQLEKLCEELSPETTHKDFRLWLTSYPTDRFPVVLLQNGIKMTNEPPKGLRANLLQSYSSDPITDRTFYDGNAKQTMFEKMLFGLCFFHAIVQERRQFGPIGWNIPYEFNDSDLRISARQLKNFLNQYDAIPYDALRYLTGEANYGGRVTDDKDRRALMTLLELYYTPDVGDVNYRFSPDGEYGMPPITTVEGVVEHIRTLPAETTPAVFSLHANADMTKNQLETDAFFGAVLQTQSRSGGHGEGGRTEHAVAEMAVEMLHRLPPPFNVAHVAAAYPTNYNESMNTVLLQEVIRYSGLLEAIRASLINIQKALQGLIVMSPDLEEMASAMLNGTIPKLWTGKSYPSLKPLSSYFADFLARLQFFTKWEATGQPIVFWLPGFFFPQSFLTGVLQNYARKYAIPIDLLDFQYTVLPTRTSGVRAEEGQYITGLFLEGARWDTETSSLEESHPRVLYDRLPLVWLQPGERSRFPVVQAYTCPVYKTSARRGTLSTTGHSTNFVMSLRLLTPHVPEAHWIRRGVATLLALND
ncbi:hypothetical protein CXG81DRAFT_14142 [Caulochytrium protostelioides]|uniref:Dynein heavy chain, cytosolic n=1 Tax=Caulochytrium protostelioides TaxID=1555241 RepID=A0A4P9X3T4_9FUNG|nr:hypothetical protein CXG81DRAFT_14142 [Caulochytrium protostelioides]|eukprot:RKO99706.1 hypothetical protein CXG81DRAFT_14142 [Caulochytrium protostelioides]